MKYVSLLLLYILLSFNVKAVDPITGTLSACVGATAGLTNSTTGGRWISSAPSIATVVSGTGVVTGVSAGTTVITYLVGISFVTEIFTVNPLPGPILGGAEVCVGSSITLSNSSPGGTWESLNTAVATIGSLSGVLYGVSTPSLFSYATSVIQYRLPTGCTAIRTATVHPLPSEIVGMRTVSSIAGGDTATLTDTILGGRWSSSNTYLATVGSTNGFVRGLNSGMLFISYTLPTGCLRYTRFQVNPLPDRSVVGGLLAWYPFCTVDTGYVDTLDHSGNGRALLNYGTITARARPDTDRFNSPMGACRFNGVNTKMQYTTFFPLTSTTNDFTYSCWIYPTSAQNSIIMYNGTPFTNGCGFYMSDALGSGPGNMVGVLMGGVRHLATSVSINNWHNLILVKNGNSYRFYVDYTSIGFFIDGILTPTGVFSIGAEYASTLGGGPVRLPFDGKIDDIAIYDRQLSTIERQEMFNFNPNVRRFTLGNDTTICGDSLTLFPIPQTSSHVYNWSTGDTTDTLIRVFPLPLFSGNNYGLTISIPYGCSQTDNITVYKVPIPINLGRDTNICTGDTIRLSANYPGSRFRWGNGDTAHFLRVATTGTYSVTIDSTYHFLRTVGPDASGAFYTITDSSVCIGRDTINVHRSRVPRVDLGPDIARCDGSYDTLRSAYSDTAYTYVWSNFSNGDSLIVNTSGNYWLQVTDTGCSRRDTVNVLIVFDTLNFYPNDTAICIGQYVNTYTTGNPLLTYQWTPTAGIALSTSPSPRITPDTSAMYYLRASLGGCPDLIDSFYIDVQPYPYVYVGGNRTVCEFDTLRVQPIVLPRWFDRFIYDWTPGTYLDDSTKPYVVFTAGDTTSLRLIVTTSAGCSGKDSAMIYTYDGNYLGGDTSIAICPGIPFNISTRLLKYWVTPTFHWYPAHHLDNAYSATPVLTAITSEQYIGVGTSQYGCRDTFTLNVAVYPGPSMYLGDSVVLHPGETYQMSPISNCTYFSWSPAIGLSDTNVSNPVAMPITNTLYKVKGTTADGCEVIDSINIRVDPETIIAVPNAFRPGSGPNSTFKIIKRGIATINYLRIFNRWGVMVFETTNINEGWDGMFNNVEQPFGVYVYELEGLTNAGKLFRKQGNLTLIR